MSPQPSEVWLADLGLAAKTRPVIVVSRFDPDPLRALFDGARAGRGRVDAFVPDGLQARPWQRRFAAATGLVPKAFARITRLQHVV